MGIEHKESLQECQISPEGMPLTWAREHGIDTRIPGFAHHDQDGDGVSTLMEWKHGTRPTDRLSRPRGHVAMKGISPNTLAHPRFDRARLHPSRRRVLAAPGFGTAANQRNSSRPAWLRPPIRSVLAPPRHPAPGGTNRRFYFAPSEGDHILYQPPAIATGFHHQANVIACRQLFGSQIGGMLRARNGQRTNASCPFPESGQTDGFRCRIGTPFSHSTPHQRSPRIRRWAYPWRSHPAEIRFAETDSTSPAYGTETPVLPLAFNRSGVSRHPADPRPRRPSSYLRCKTG